MNEYLKQKPKQLIIIGGGTSINEGLKKGLWKKIRHQWTVGINYSYRYFDSTLLCFADKDFYNEESKNERFKKLSLIIGKQHKINILPNTITLRANSKYKRDLSEGVYKSSLTGLFALSLGIYLLDAGEIYLLGFDFGELRKKDYTKFANSKQFLNKVSYKDKKGRALTHFYQGHIKHRGIGKISYYNSKNRAQKDFEVYQNEKKVKIFNVSLVSKIPNSIFPKISYDEFFARLDNNKYCQSYIRAYIKSKLAEIK